MIDRPFVQGSATSRAAARLADADGGRARVLAVIKAHPLGLTRQEIGELLGMGGDTVRPRVAELLDRKLIQPSGEIRRTVTGRPCEVLEVAS